VHSWPRVVPCCLVAWGGVWESMSGAADVDVGGGGEDSVELDGSDASFQRESVPGGGELQDALGVIQVKILAP